jgi:ATP-binding cassette subfamily F protein 3
MVRRFPYQQCQSSGGYFARPCICDNITNRTIEVTMGVFTITKQPILIILNYGKNAVNSNRNKRRPTENNCRTKEFIERFKGTYSKTLQVQSRVKMLEKLEWWKLTK